MLQLTKKYDIDVLLRTNFYASHFVQTIQFFNILFLGAFSFILLALLLTLKLKFGMWASCSAPEPKCQ